MRLHGAALLILLLFSFFPRAFAQDSSLYAKLYNLPDKLFTGISEKSQKLERKLDRQTARYLARLERQETKMRNKLWKKDSAAAKALFGDVKSRYQQLQTSGGSSTRAYSGHLDSMQTTLRFLQQQGALRPSADAKYASALSGMSNLQEKLNQTENIKRFLKDRQQQLKAQLQQFGLVREFKQFQKDVYYYRQQVDEYKHLLADPSKLEARLLDLALKVPAFREFFNKHSALASMFRLPGSSDPTAAIAGLQTRASIQQQLLDRFGSGPDVSRAMQQNMQRAQQQLNQLKDKLMNLGENGADLDLQGFKPNSQKTKSFWQRIELGANFQSSRSTNYFPVTSDIALLAGYKLNNKSIIGVGASYKLGWGENIRHIRLTNEGAGLRSFLDWQMKGSIYLSGGFEYNYQEPFGSLRQLYGADNWHQSGLIGVSKIVSVQNKFFKKTRLQLLWDFLSYEQVPRTQPLKFRVGYSFK